MKQSALFTISAPSGAGKTSLVKALLERRPDEVTVAVSHTTRPMRPGEADGRDYHFVDIETFERMVEAGEFLEYARVFDNYYGTSRAAVEALLEQERHVILEIDWQGARQVRQQLPETLAVFILPPSRDELQRRLCRRGTDDEAVIARRMADADREMAHYRDAQYLVINDVFDDALFDLESIVRNQSLLRERQERRYAQLIASLPRAGV
jgi:guanylate kinase